MMPATNHVCAAPFIAPPSLPECSWRQLCRLLHTRDRRRMLRRSLQNCQDKVGGLRFGVGCLGKCQPIPTVIGTDYAEGVTHHSPGLPRLFSGYPGAMVESSFYPEGVASRLNVSETCLPQRNPRRGRSGLVFAAQGSRQGRQPWAMSRNAFGVMHHSGSGGDHHETLSRGIACATTKKPTPNLRLVETVPQASPRRWLAHARHQPPRVLL